MVNFWALKLELKRLGIKVSSNSPSFENGNKITQTFESYMQKNWQYLYWRIFHKNLQQKKEVFFSRVISGDRSVGVNPTLSRLS